MKFITKFNKIQALPNSTLKKLKFIGLAFSCIPLSKEQEQAKKEIDKLIDLGY